ncbi:hypothetical protein ACQUFY_11155 [Robbsia andropogonis]|uniref:hypothetical protein n=1 Tax=Robbsia andropogonis TaxID=28092 RepID=UPI003D2204EB
MNAFIRPLALGDLDGPSLAIEDTIPVAGLKTVRAVDAISSMAGNGVTKSPNQAARDETTDIATRRIVRVFHRVHRHAPAVRRVLDNGWHADTRVGHAGFGAAAAVSNAWVRGALAADFTGGLRVGAALHGIFGFKPTYASHVGLPMYCVGALAPDMQALVDLAAALDDRFDETQAMHPSEPIRVAWLASDDQRGGAPSARDNGYLGAKDWSKVQDLLIDACRRHALQAQSTHPEPHFDTYTGAPARNRTVRLCGIAEAAAAARLIAQFAGRANEDSIDTPTLVDISEALHQARTFRLAVDEALTHVDVLALPTLPAGDGNIGIDRLTRVFNLSGHPAVTLPLPFDMADGRPHALQLIGRHGDDARLCGAARWFDDMFARHPAAQWINRNPARAAGNNAFTAYRTLADHMSVPGWLTARAG